MGWSNQCRARTGVGWLRLPAHFGKAGEDAEAAAAEVGYLEQRSDVAHAVVHQDAHAYEQGRVADDAADLGQGSCGNHDGSSCMGFAQLEPDPAKRLAIKREKRNE